MILNYTKSVNVKTDADSYDPYGLLTLELEYVKLIHTKKKSDFDGYDEGIFNMYHYEMTQKRIKELKYMALTKSLSSIVHDCVIFKSKCFYCHSPIQKKILIEEKYQSQMLFAPKGVTGDSNKHEVFYCESCGWWTIHIEEINESYMGNLDYHWFIVGSAMEYDINDFDLPIKLARQYLKNNPHKLANFNPYKFELLIKDCLEDLYGKCEIIHMGFRKDKGIDLKLFRHDNKVILVQIKRRSNLNSNESVDVVRNLHGVMFREGLSDGIIVTTAKGYTKDAIEETKVLTNPNTYSMKLFAFNDVVDLLNLPTQNPYCPWDKYYKLYKKNEIKFEICRVDFHE